MNCYDFAQQRGRIPAIAADLMDQHIAPVHYEFGGFRLDTNLQVLIPPSGLPIHLTSKVFLTLLYLVEHAGMVADKRVLMQAVWPNVVVEENNLNQCIAAIRKALGETAADRRFLLTIPGRGFKFVAPITVRRPDAETLPASTPVTPRGHVTLMRTLLGLSVAAVMVAGAWLYLRIDRPVTYPSEYEQLTDVAEAASAPALSRDGRLLAYVLGGEQFMGAGQLYVKPLPHGEPIRLTQLQGSIYAPAFSPDGSRIAFTHVPEGAGPTDWETLTVSILGGTPTRLLPNSSALSWIGPDTLMYSEVESGIHMGIVTSSASRSAHRAIYFPAHERGMAHFSFISPDEQSVLVAEMSPSGEFGRCRLVPFDGHSRGAPVGPAGVCESAAWSPDGQWMYFAATEGRYSHLWRQRFPHGDAQQITFGPVKETAVLAAPDGRSLLTSLGTDQSAIWMHDDGGERRLTAGTSAWQPWLSQDRRRLYYLRRESSLSSPIELIRVELSTGIEQLVLPGIDIQDYDISPDERDVLFTGADGKHRVSIAPLDRHAPPRTLAEAADQAVFAGEQQVIFRHIGQDKNYVYRLNLATGEAKQVLPNAIWDVVSVSPDGRLIVVGMEVEGKAGTVIFRSDDAAPVSRRQGYWPVRWSPDGKTFYLQTGGEDSTALTLAKPANTNGMPLDLSATTADTNSIPYSLESFYPTNDAAVYVFVSSEQRRNIFRIPLH